MSDDLIAQLRDAHSFMGDPLLKEAADALAAQAARVEAAESRVEAMERAIRRAISFYDALEADHEEGEPEVLDALAAALAKKGGE